MRARTFAARRTLVTLYAAPEIAKHGEKRVHSWTATAAVIVCLTMQANAEEPPATSPDKLATVRETIVVTGTYEPIPVEEADRAVRSLEVRSQETLANSLVDFLRLDPSISLGQRAPDGVQADVSIRGGTFAQTLVLLNGWRLNDVQTGHHNMDIPVPLDTLERIEILRGAGSTLYGSDAVGGVIQFISRPPEVTELRLRTAIGNFGVNQQRGSLSLVGGRLAQQFAFSRDFSSGFRPNRDYRNLSLASLTNISSPWGPTEILLAHNDRPFGADRFYGNFDSWERTRTWFAGVRQGLGKSDELSFAFRRHTDLFVLYRHRPWVFTNRHAVRGYQASWRRRQRLADNVRLFTGVEGFRDTITSANLGEHGRARLAGFLALDVRALRRFSFSLGAREELHGWLQGQLSPSVSGGYWLSERFKVRASVSRAFRMPSFTDLYYHDPANRGSPDLKPERAWNYELGLDWTAGTHLRGDIAVFERREQDVIDYVRASPGDLWRATNIHRLRFRGIEASASARLRRTHRLDAAYSALDGAREVLPGIQSRYVFNYPVHSATVGYLAPLPCGWMARSRLGVAKQLARDPYAVWDLYIARGVGRLRPFLQLTNLTNTRYEEIFGVPMPGRAVVVGLQFSVLSSK